MGAGKKRERLSGQAIVETAIAGAFVVMLIFAVIAAGLTMWRKSDTDYQLTTMARELPDGWESEDKKELVRDLVCEGSSLDPSKLTVNSAELKYETKESIDEDDPVATELGSTSARHKETWLTVEANITYDATAPVALFGQTSYTRSVSGSYLIDRLYEVF